MAVKISKEAAKDFFADLFKVDKIQVLKPDGKPLVKFDTTISIERSSEVEQPDYPIERGAFTNDSKYKKPKLVTVVAQVAPMLALTRYNTRYSIKKIVKTLEEAKNGTDLFTIVGKLEKHENMSLTKFAYEEVRETGRALRCTLEFKEVMVFDTFGQSVAVKSPAAAAKPKSEGRKTPKKVTDAKAISELKEFEGAGR